MQYNTIEKDEEEKRGVDEDKEKENEEKSWLTSASVWTISIVRPVTEVMTSSGLQNKWRMKTVNYEIIQSIVCLQS